MKQLQTRAFVGGAIAFALLAFVAPAWAHEGAHGAGGFTAGLLHPILSWDHIVVMAAGAALGMAGIALLGVEAGISASAIVLGVAVPAALRAPVPVAMLVVGAFAVFHGHAHGTELPATANVASYSAGFVIATGLLHLAGLGIGGLVRWPAGRIAVRALGGVVALTGAGFLARLI